MFVCVLKVLIIFDFQVTWSLASIGNLCPANGTDSSLKYAFSFANSKERKYIKSFTEVIGELFLLIESLQMNAIYFRVCTVVLSCVLIIIKITAFLNQSRDTNHLRTMEGRQRSCFN